jgi:sodium-dependent phosphate cotransporter
MFNILSVLVLLPIELLTRYLEVLTSAILGNPEQYKLNITLLDNVTLTTLPKVDFLKVITDPFTKLIVEVDSKILDQIAVNKNCCDDKTLVKHGCRNKTSGNCKIFIFKFFFKKKNLI